MNTHKPDPSPNRNPQVPLSGYFALVFAILVFSGIFASSKGWITVFDFDTLNGKFGTMKDATKNTFVGAGGSGAKDGFMFALSLVPGVMLALGIMEVVEHLGGLKAAQRLLSPILRPLIGIPGIAGVALISSLQSTDAGAGMTRALYENGQITEKERLIFAAFQFTAGGTVTNYLSSGSALFAFLTIPTMWPLVVLFLMKIIGANILRLYLYTCDKRSVSHEG
jgi:nucleoside recognition membrane protein YjiH